MVVSASGSPVPLGARLAGAGVPGALAAVLAQLCTLGPEERQGDAGRCPVGRERSLEVVLRLEEELAHCDSSREALAAVLGTLSLLFGAEEAGRLVLRHVEGATKLLASMGETMDEDALMAVAVRAEPIMMRAALERVAAEDPCSDRQLDMDESVLLPGFLLVPQGSGMIELNGALVSTPRGFVFMLSGPLLSPGTVEVPPGAPVRDGAVLFGLEEIEEAVLLVPDGFDAIEAGPGIDVGLTPDGDIYAHFDVTGQGLVSICLAYSHWPPDKQGVLRRRFETMAERAARALRSR